MKHSFRLLLAAAAAAALAGCSSVPVDDGSSTTAAAEKPTDVKTVETVDPLNDPKGPLAKRSVYFALDSYSIDSSYYGLIAAHADYLVKNKGRTVVVEGNADERGSSEYNLALGQKRSEAVVERLKLLGVPASRLQAISYGKEKPVAHGSNEEAWAKNRRADIRYR